MKKLKYNPIVKGVALLLFVVSCVIFATSISINNQLRYWDFPYTTVEEQKEYRAISMMEGNAYDIFSDHLSGNNYRRQEMRVINQTEDHNYRYEFSSLDNTGTKNIAATYGDEKVRYSHTSIRNLMKQTMVNKNTQETYDSYYYKENDSSENMEYTDYGYYGEIAVDSNQYQEFHKKYGETDITTGTPLKPQEINMPSIGTNNYNEVTVVKEGIAFTSSGVTSSYEFESPPYTSSDMQVVISDDQRVQNSVFDEYDIYQKKVDTYTVHSYYINNPTLKDALDMSFFAIDSGYSVGYKSIALIWVSTALVIALGIYLLCSFGRKTGHSEIVLTKLDRVPLDVYVFINFMIVLIGSFSMISTMDSGIYNELVFINSETAYMIFCTGMLLVLAFLGVRTVIVRIKAGTLFRNNYTWKILHFITRPIHKPYKMVKNHIKDSSIVSKVVFWSIVYFIGSTFFSFVIPISPVFNLIEKIILIPMVIAIAVMLKKLQTSGEVLAGGDLSHTVDTKNLVGNFKKHGESLNQIKAGLSTAVDKQMKSERLKSELITNVSHDIKTPLTSIINYVDLIGKEKSENPKIDEYTEILARQSDRLKKLVEDLVSASKASTGDVDVNLESCLVNVLLAQTMGEYAQRLEKQGLEIVSTLLSEPVAICADGRLLWRVFDNMLNNICKYAQPKTRVYLDLKIDGEDVIISLKNISKYPLNITSQELMERFVRGDSSRHTEGSGLGLSIAESLVTLQKGKMDLIVDGDLFKIVLTFKVIENKQPIKVEQDVIKDLEEK